MELMLTQCKEMSEIVFVNGWGCAKKKNIKSKLSHNYKFSNNVNTSDQLYAKV